MLEAIADKQSQKEEKHTKEWLKSFDGFEGYSNEQAEEELSSLKTFAEIVCQHLLNTS